MTNSADPDSWLLQKPADLDLHCLQRQDVSGFSRTRAKHAVVMNVDKVSMIQLCSRHCRIYTANDVDPDWTLQITDWSTI